MIEPAPAGPLAEPAPAPGPVPAPPTAKWPRLRAAAPHALVLLAFSGLTVFQTWPVARDWRTHLVGGTNDTLMNAWHMWWMRQALWVHPHNPFQTPFLHHPLGAQLYWHTLAPIKTAWGAVLLGFLTADQAYNWVFLATFVATGYTSWLLFRYLLGRGGFGPLLAALGAFAGACAFDFSRYHLCQAFAHLNLSSVEGIPFYLLCFFRYLDDGGRKHLWGAALAALYVALCDYYYLAYVATFSALWVVGACWSKGGVFRLATLRDPTVRRALWVGAAAALCCSPLLAALGAHAFPAPVNTMHGDSDYYVDAMGLLGPDRFSAYAGTLASWKTTVEKLPGNTEENGFFLGYLTVALALFGLVRGIPDGRRWAMLGLFYLVLSFGIHLSVDGKTDLPPQYLVGMFALLALATAPLRTAGPRRDVAIFLTLATDLRGQIPHHRQRLGVAGTRPPALCALQERGAVLQPRRHAQSVRVAHRPGHVGDGGVRRRAPGPPGEQVVAPRGRGGRARPRRGA